MINRLLLREKAVQTLYSFYVSGGADADEMERELIDNVKSSGDIYYYLLQMIVEMKRFLEQAAVHSATEDAPEKSEIYSIMSCRKFRENRVSALLEINEELAEALVERNLVDAWRMHRDVLTEIAVSAAASPAFERYHASDSSSMDEDVALWCDILENSVQSSSKMDEMLEEMNIYWNDDMSNAVAFVIKTIRRLNPAQGAEQPLQPIIKNMNEMEYAKRLLRYAILHSNEADQKVTPLLKGWKLDRLSIMDLTILRAAYAELQTNIETHAGIIINEYTEIAKSYCSDYSVPFISAVLYPLAREIRPLEVKSAK